MLGEYLEELRARRGWSLRRAAEHLELSHMYIRQLELGYDKRTGKPFNVSEEVLRRFAKVYNVDLDTLIEIKKDTP